MALYIFDKKGKLRTFVFLGSRYKCGELRFIWEIFPSAERQHHEPAFLLKFVMETRLDYESLDGMIDFLAFVVRNSLPKTPI